MVSHCVEISPAPVPSPWTWDLTVQDPPGWPILGTCSNLFSWGLPPHANICWWLLKHIRSVQASGTHHNAVMDPGFSHKGGGCRPLNLEQKTYYLAIFLPKTAWKWKKMDPEGVARAWRPLGSANKLEIYRIRFITRMHSSRMRTARCSGHLSWHACPCHPPLAMYAPYHTHSPLHMPPCHTPPAMHTPTMHTPSTYVPHVTHTPCHACPPAMHTPQPCPPCHACPLLCTPPAMHALPLAMHAPGHACPQPRMPPGQTDTCENITFPNFVCGR